MINKIAVPVSMLKIEIQIFVYDVFKFEFVDGSMGHTLLFNDHHNQSIIKMND